MATSHPPLTRIILLRAEVKRLEQENRELAQNLKYWRRRKSFWFWLMAKFSKGG